MLLFKENLMKYNETKKKKPFNLKPDPVLKNYWRNNSRFSDLFNQVFFDGEESIQPDKLSDEDTEESSVITIDGEISSISRTRDLIKQYEDGAEFVLLGVENQSYVHYAMPVRTLLYNSLRYTRQCKELEEKNRAAHKLKESDEFLSGITKHDRIKPVITLVIYYGEKEWDGPISLSDMMDIPPFLKKFYNDQKIYLLQIRNISNLSYSFKNQDNRDFFAMVEEFYSNNGTFDLPTFKSKYPRLEIDWETLAAIGVATGSMQLVDYAYEYKGGSISMCTALDNLFNEGKTEGRTEGWIEGLIEGRAAEKVSGKISLISLKYRKGLSISTISDHLEMAETEVNEIIQLIIRYPNASTEELIDIYLNTIKI